MTTAWQYTAANLRRPPLKPGHWFRGRLTPEILPVQPPPCDSRHLPPASELPSRPTYSRPPSDTTSIHRATRFRSSSARQSAPGDSHPTPLHRDGYHSAISTEPTAHYLPETLCARTPTFYDEQPQVFPAQSRIAATPSIAISLGWLPRKRRRPIHDTLPLIPGFQEPSPRYLRTAGDPRGAFVFPVSPRYRQLPVRTSPLSPPSWR